MGTTIQFKTTLLLGNEESPQEVPLFSELVLGQENSQDGVENGFIFRLDREPFDPPVTIYLGDAIGFIEDNLNGPDLSQSSDMGLITSAFGIQPGDFNAQNGAFINVYEFSLNSSTSETLFKFSFDMEGADPDTGLVPLPEAFSSWLRIDSLAITFSATTTSDNS